MVLHDREFFELAVYRVSPEAWFEDTSQRLSRRTEVMLLPKIEKGMEIHEDDRIWADTWSRRAEKVYGWDYNEVIGWIRVLWDGPGPVVKAYAWEVGHVGDAQHDWKRRRRYQRGFTPFPFFGGVPIFKVGETWLDDRQSDEEIYQEIRACLCAVVAKDGAFPKRHLDLRIFDNVAPFMRWRELVGFAAT